MTLRVKSGCTRNIVEIRAVSRVWFEYGRVWFTKEDTDCRLPYGDQLMEVIA